ncbi:hypothetical protein PC116_g17268 [Phytophthora cactorum]|nr:hypothetical protein PC116_g17268 [Phytophthora cactorum]
MGVEATPPSAPLVRALGPQQAEVVKRNQSKYDFVMGSFETIRTMCPLFLSVLHAIGAATRTSVCSLICSCKKQQSVV